jgi:sirohydrochlorin ferrochelatase
VHLAERPHCFLFDNGSLRAAATLSLRRVALRFAEKTGATVSAVSLLHSSGVDAAELEGVPAELLEPALLKWLPLHPQGRAILLPFFFGPSGALTEYLPTRLRAIRQKFPDADLRLGSPLVNIQESDTRIAAAIVSGVARAIEANALVRPKVLLVDHGSPHYTVALVRNHLGQQVRQLLGAEITDLAVASMERRPGPDFAFNDPLLANAFAHAPFDRGDVIVALQFLSPGRHAGEDGDITQICAEAARGHGLLRTFCTEPIGQDLLVTAVLHDRYLAAADDTQ